MAGRRIVCHSLKPFLFKDCFLFPQPLSTSSPAHTPFPSPGRLCGLHLQKGAAVVSCSSRVDLNKQGRFVVVLMANLPHQKTTLYVGGLAEEVNEAILHAAFIPFGDIKDVVTPMDQATQHHRSFGFVTFLEKEDASAAMDNMNNAELYGRVLTVNYAQPIRIKGGEQGWASQAVWNDADTWFERQQKEEEMKKAEAEQRAAQREEDEEKRKKLIEEREGEKEEETDMKTDPMAAAESEVLDQNN